MIGEIGHDPDPMVRQVYDLHVENAHDGDGGDCSSWLAERVAMKLSESDTLARWQRDQAVDEVNRIRAAAQKPGNRNAPSAAGVTETNPREVVVKVVGEYHGTASWRTADAVLDALDRAGYVVVERAATPGDLAALVPSIERALFGTEDGGLLSDEDASVPVGEFRRLLRDEWARRCAPAVEVTTDRDAELRYDLGSALGWDMGSPDYPEDWTPSWREILEAVRASREAEFTASVNADDGPAVPRTIRVTLDVSLGAENFRTGRGLPPGTTLADGVAGYVRDLVGESAAFDAGDIDAVWAVDATNAPADSPLRTGGTR